MDSPTLSDPEVRTRSADLPTETMGADPEVRTGESRSAKCGQANPEVRTRADLGHTTRRLCPDDG